MKNAADERAAREQETTTDTVAILYRYSVSRIFSLRADLEAVLAEFEGTTPRGKDFERLVQIAYEGLPGNVDWQTLEDSLRHLAGTFVTRDLLRDTCWRLAGNYQRLNQRRAVPPWHGQRLYEWVPVQVATCRHDRSGSGKVGVTYGFRVLAGTSCPLVTWKWWSIKQVRFFAREFGFSALGHPNARTPPKYPFGHPAQLVGMRAWVLIDPTLCGREPVFSKIAWPSTVVAHNKVMIRARFRKDEGYDCPKGYPALFACHKCPHGFKTCPAGTHREDWTEALCPTCGKPDAYFDAEIPANMCVDCYTASVFGGNR